MLNFFFNFITKYETKEGTWKNRSSSLSFKLNADEDKDASYYETKEKISHFEKDARKVLLLF